MNAPSRTSLTLLTLLIMVGAATAQTIIVNTSADIVDFGGAQQVSDLPGPDGKVSLPEAGLASDNTPGIQTIAFNVPQSEWDYQWLFPGRAVLRPFLGFRIFQPAIIDATTQTDFTGDTNPNGGEVVIWQETWLNDNVGSEVRGFDNSSFHLSGGSNNTIQGNTLTNIEVYDSGFNLIGGSGPGEGNTCGTIKIDRASDNTVIGNTTTRVRVLGWFGNGQPAANNRIGGPSAGERNYITGYGTWEEHGAPAGTTVQIFDSQGTIIENNSIGTTPDGMAQGSLASTAGIGFEGENHGTLILNNRIAGILGHGIGQWSGYVFGSAITLYGTGGDITIRGNVIGLNAAGEPVLGSVTGIGSYDYFLGPVQGVTIGGQNPGAGNEIAGHLVNGIVVANPLVGVTISGNSIHDNAGIGIDLVTPGFQYGVTPNDPLDTDSGGNGLQNFPVISSATRQGATVHVAGALHSSPLGQFTIEFFASPACDPSGFGEGQVYLGAASVSTDAAGNVDFDVVLSASVVDGSVITATATLEPLGSTSEFSACVAVQAGASPGDLNCDGVVNFDDINPFVLALSDPAGYSAAYPNCSIQNGDCNGDGLVDFDDINAFVALLSGF
jgi:hypothetical protein